MNVKCSHAIPPRKVFSLSMLLKGAAAVAVLGAAMVIGPETGRAAPVEYVKICNTVGAPDYFYLPGSDFCGNSSGLPGQVVTAYGTLTNTPGANATAYGQHSFAYGDQSLALGNNSWSGGDPTTASPGPLGGNLGIPDPSNPGQTMAPGSLFFNSGTTAIGENSRAGAGAAGQINATAVGENAIANAANASAFGQGSNASGAYSTAFGVSSSASAEYSIATGVYANASGVSAVAIGSGNGSTVQGANASGQYALAFGGGSNATQTGSIAVGYKAASTGANAIAIGSNAVATGSVAVGNSSSASNGGAAFGDFAAATGSKSASLGYGASATAANSLALGAGASATGANSVAIGAGSVATGANTVSFGSASNLRRLTNIAPGIGPNDAVNTVQFNNGLASTLATAEDYTNQSVGQLSNNLNKLQRESFGGIAAAVAMGEAPMPSTAGKTTLSVHASMFENYTGGGIAFSHRLDTDMPLSLDGGYAHAANENVGRVGLSLEF